MAIRAICLKKGHKFKEVEDVFLPYVFCSRWFCNGCSVSWNVPPELAVPLHNAIPWADRFPQVALDLNGRAIRRGYTYTGEDKISITKDGIQKIGDIDG